ncbi:TrlF family AAA-like ATPase [Paludibaculum fermentans]|uniref:TrlF family AAA-like ATPase n=1 Tax=Paludibaculum fermentans TaxID=1473598 RepID=UPI003EB84144
MSLQPEVGRGSIWRKWDLHVHSPASALANEFADDWGRYVAALAALKDISVLGITDYFSIEGYRRVLEHRSELSNIDLILPNIELRLNTFVGKGARRINYHVIFSNEVTPDQIENHFLTDLRFQRDGSLGTGPKDWPLTRNNLENLGTELKGQGNFPGSPYAVGCMNATVDPTQVQKVLIDKASVFGGRYLLILAEEDLSKLQWDGQDHHTRRLIIQGCHAVFTANEGSIKWYRGEGDLTPNEFRAEYSSLKPCYHGSDAHSIEKIGKPDKGRFCWIKADPTFEGLKQTLYEPAERVFIGSEPPRLKGDYQIIESVRIDNAAQWFDSKAIPLNKDLVTVVGGKGSGKSALAEMIAYAGGSKLFSKPQTTQKPEGFLEETFIKRATAKSDGNPAPLHGARIELRWLDGKVDVAEIGTPLNHAKEEEKVKYLPQKFVESLCAAENTDGLQREIERIIYLNLPEADRARAGSFDELRNSATQSITMRRRSFEQAIRGFNESISQRNAKIAQQAFRNKELDQRRSELEALEKQPPTVPAEHKAELDRVEVLTRSKQNLESQIAALNEKISKVAALDTHVDLFVEAIMQYNAKARILSKDAGLESKVEVFLVAPPTQSKEVIDDHRRVLADQIRILRQGTDDGKTPLTNLASLQAELQALRVRLAAVETKRKEHQAHIEQKTKLENSIDALEREIQEVNVKEVPALGADIVGREEKYCEVLDLLLEERQVFEKLYGPLKEALAQADSTAKKLGFNSRVTFDSRRAASRLMELFDMRSALRDEDELAALLADFFRKLSECVRKKEELERFDLQAVRRTIQELETSLVENVDGDKTKKIGDQLRRTHTREEFDNELFNPQWFMVSYALHFDGKQLQLLSPGERGIVLLLLYLEAEQSDHRPLIIDQPEDNLDNESIYPSLVEYFRKRKHHRQIIIITHNPNLVVNTDSEQVIVPSFDGSRKPYLTYWSGGLENTSTIDGGGIREKVCKVLEGGRDAFRKREEKYAIA